MDYGPNWKSTMATRFAKALQNVRAWAQQHGIEVRKRRLTPEKAGMFNGLSVTINSAYSLEEQTYYLVHAVGSISSGLTSASLS